MLHFTWVEATFEVLEVESIEERAIGASTSSASASAPTTLTRASTSAVTALSATFNCWYSSSVATMFLFLVDLRDSEGFSELDWHTGHSANTITKLVVLDFGLGQHDVQVILNLNPINQLLQHWLLCNLVPIICDCRKYCLEAWCIFYKPEGVLFPVDQDLLRLKRDSVVSQYDALLIRVGSFILMDQRK